MTNLLYKYSQRKRGWRVRFLLGPDGKKPIQGKLMIVNGHGAEYLIQVEDGTPEDKVDHYLEDLTTKFLKDVEERDLLFVSRESLMFMVFAQVIRSQSQQFVGYLTHEKKKQIKIFNKQLIYEDQT